VGPNNVLFAADPITGNKILNSSTGTIIGTFPGSSPVVGSTNAYVLVGGTLQSLTISSQQINWSFSGDGSFLNTPIAVDNTIFTSTGPCPFCSSGTVYAINALTGAQLWSVSTGDAITNRGLAAAYGYLVVPTGNGLTAWKIVP
jgi:outer membrane protein assembly factor BamB